jgi:hypothetical protein
METPSRGAPVCFHGLRNLPYILRMSLRNGIFPEFSRLHIVFLVPLNIFTLDPESSSFTSRTRFRISPQFIHLVFRMRDMSEISRMLV